MTTMADGWNYEDNPPAEGDCRKLVTLEEDGMIWIGIRAFHHHSGKWLNGGEPERATVKAWQHLPEPAHGWWDRGILRVRLRAASSDTQLKGYAMNNTGEKNSASTGRPGAPFAEGRGAAKVASSPVLAGDFPQLPKAIWWNGVQGSAASLADNCEAYAQVTPIEGRWKWALSESARWIRKVIEQRESILATAPKPPAPVPRTDDALREILAEAVEGYAPIIADAIKTCPNEDIFHEVGVGAALAAMRRVSQHTPDNGEGK